MTHNIKVKDKSGREFNITVDGQPTEQAAREHVEKVTNLEVIKDAQREEPQAE